MKRREFITLLGGAAAAWPLAARAQQRERVRRIGVLMSQSADDPDALAWISAFAQGLQERGWSVGGNVRIDYRWGAGDLDRFRIRDLKGKTVAVPELGSAHHVFVATMAAHVGIDPKREINFVSHPAAESMQLLAEGKVDAMMGFPPDPQELREKKIGHVIVNSGLDRPWSQYFCCIAAAHRDFVRNHPVATKRALRAILKATHFCAAEPERAARLIADKGYRYDYSLQTMKEIQYARWRDFDAEDTVRFYALRLYEAGMIKSTPSKIIAQGTDWRFFNQLKRELKG